MPRHPLEQRVNYDVYTDSFTSIDAIHMMVHRGRTFIVSYKTVDASPIADNASIRMLIAVGARPIHLTFECITGGEGEIEFFEGTTSSNNGTELNVIHMCRHMRNFNSTTKVYANNTVSADGFRLLNEMIPGGSGTGPNGARVGSTVRDGTEWILNANTTYMIRVYNRASAVAQASIEAQWYEGDSGQ